MHTLRVQLLAILLAASSGAGSVASADTVLVEGAGGRYLLGFSVGYGLMDKGGLNDYLGKLADFWEALDTDVSRTLIAGAVGGSVEVATRLPGVGATGGDLMVGLRAGYWQASAGRVEIHSVIEALSPTGTQTGETFEARSRIQVDSTLVPIEVGARFSRPLGSRSSWRVGAFAGVGFAQVERTLESVLGSGGLRRIARAGGPGVVSGAGIVRFSGIGPVVDLELGADHRLGRRLTLGVTLGIRYASAPLSIAADRDLDFDGIADVHAGDPWVEGELLNPANPEKQVTVSFTALMLQVSLATTF